VTRRQIQVFAAGGIAVALLAAACGGAGEVVNEQLLESIEGVENVEINQDDGSFEITIEEDGESITIGGGEIPEGLTVPVPSGGDVVGAASSDTDISVSLMFPGDQYDDLVAQYQSWADGSGEEVAKSESTYDSDGTEIRNVSWSTNSGSVFVTVSDCISVESGEFDSACVTIYEQS
jgi:hypothetical protein